MHKILIVNPKGGVGKSTLATNLAGWLAKSGHAVMLGDTDRQQSSGAWLQRRPAGLPHVSTWEFKAGAPARAPRGTAYVVLDTAAGLHGRKLAQTLNLAHRAIVPLSPSLFDILATRQFLDELLVEQANRARPLDIAFVGIRMNPRTHAASELDRFLKDTGLPVLAHLRDTQNYVQAAAHGLSIFDLPAARAAPDWEQWLPILRWAVQST